MASYNAEKFIEFALDSVVAQKFQNLEVILIDGLSTDLTLEIAQKYRERLVLKIVSEKDEGVNDAFRKGFLLAEGDYICHLCATDGYMDINWIAKSLKFLMSNRNYSAIFSSGAMELDESGTPKYLWRPWIRELYRRLPYSRHKLVACGSSEIFPDMGWMVRRTVFMELFPDKRNESDYGEFNPFLGFIKALYFSQYHFVVLPQTTSYGRQHAGQWGSQITDETRPTLRNFKNCSRKYLWSLRFNPPQLYNLILSKFIRGFLFLAYGGIGYYLTKIREKYINDQH
jgi:glycosyltransferase involved in cell wall biosynthesis